jgi:hypothetical protein
MFRKILIWNLCGISGSIDRPIQVDKRLARPNSHYLICKMLFNIEKKPSSKLLVKLVAKGCFDLKKIIALKARQRGC